MFGQQNYGQEFDFKDGLPSEVTRKTLIDYEGSVWVGTDAGVAVFPKYDPRKVGITKMVGSSQVWDILIHNQFIYFATYDSGLFIFNLTDGKLAKRYNQRIISKIRKFKEIDQKIYILSNSGIFQINQLSLTKILGAHPFARNKKSFPTEIFKWKETLYVSYFSDEPMILFKDGKWILANDELSHFLDAGDERFKTIFGTIEFHDKLVCGTGDSRFFTLDKKGNFKTYEFTNKAGSNYVIWDMKLSQDHLYMAVGNTENFEKGLLFEFDENMSDRFVKMNGQNYFMWSITVDPFDRGIWGSTINHGIFFYPNFEHRVRLDLATNKYSETIHYQLSWKNNLLLYKRHHESQWQKLEHVENIREVLEFEGKLVIVSEDGVYYSNFPERGKPELILKNAFEDVFIHNNYLYAVNFFGPIWSYHLRNHEQLNHLPQNLVNFHATAGNESFTILHSENQGYFLLQHDSLFALKLNLAIAKRNLKFYVAGKMLYIHEGDFLLCFEIDFNKNELIAQSKIEIKLLFPNTKIDWIQGNDLGLWMGNSLMALQMGFDAEYGSLTLVKQYYLGNSKDISLPFISKKYIFVHRGEFISRTPLKSTEQRKTLHFESSFEPTSKRDGFSYPVLEQGQNFHFNVIGNDYLVDQYYFYGVHLANGQQRISKRYHTNELGVWLNGLKNDIYQINVTFTNKKINLPLIIETPLFRRSEFWIYMLVSLILLFFVFYMQQKNSFLLQQKILSLELSTIKSNMNPHFVFNVMNFVQAMIVKSDQKKALKATSELAQLNRLFLETSDKETITLKSELNLARKYINLEKLRFESDRIFDFSISIEKNLDTNTWIVPPLILQPLLENAVKHGVLLLENKTGKIKIIVLQITPNEIDINIQNTGQLISYKRIGGTGMGQKLVQDRITLFNKKFFSDYHAEFTTFFENETYSCHIRIRKLV